MVTFHMRVGVSAIPAEFTGIRTLIHVCTLKSSRQFVRIFGYLSVFCARDPNTILLRTKGTL
jgi:hypothetical protein